MSLAACPTRLVRLWTPLSLPTFHLVPGSLPGFFSCVSNHTAASAFSFPLLDYLCFTRVTPGVYLRRGFSDRVSFLASPRTLGLRCLLACCPTDLSPSLYLAVVQCVLLSVSLSPALRHCLESSVSCASPVTSVSFLSLSQGTSDVERCVSFIVPQSLPASETAAFPSHFLSVSPARTLGLAFRLTGLPLPWSPQASPRVFL